VWRVITKKEEEKELKGQRDEGNEEYSGRERVKRRKVER
jgi:hypothetical protein